MLKTRMNYWSCTKVADWIRGTYKPKWGTGEEWADWKRSAKSSHKIRFWIAEEGLDKLQDFVNFIPDCIYSIRYYVNNRWVDKTHYLRTGLEPGKWHEFDQRVLHGLFTELVDFVEIESAWNNMRWDSQKRKEFSPPWWRNWYRLWRCPEAGIDYHNWASTLVKNEDWGLNPGDLGYGDPTDQALAARKTLELYNWWTIVRPARVEPYEVSGWSKYCSENRSEDSLWSLSANKTPEEEANVRTMLDTVSTLEKQYEDEDTEKMIELIKLRCYLWT